MTPNPLRVAIIGSGPSGFYAADALQKQKNIPVSLDMFDRLPTPFGLVRGGVAPDHAKIKTVTKAYDKIATAPNFRFFGHVNLGTDLNHADLLKHYHAVIYAVGAQTDRQMNIPGEDLPGSYAATEFVAWYNAHPDYAHRQFDLSHRHVAVVGLGNVAMDVIRILAKTPEELRPTDIADYALEALKSSQVTQIYVLGRRGPAQAAFTNPEIQELGELLDADIIVHPDEIALDPLSQSYLESGADKTASKNVEIMQGYAVRGATGKRRQIVLRFLVSPVEIIGKDRVEALKIVKNELVDDGKGGLKARATDQYETLPVGLVLRSVGYYGVALPDVPFDNKAGRIPNQLGRIIGADGQPVRGEYTVGWIKRGPSGIIGTNRPDSVETVEALLADVQAGQWLAATDSDPASVEALLQARGVRYVSYSEWQILDKLEQERGAERGAPRNKFSNIAEMLQALGKA